MLVNYFKIAIAVLKRRKFFTFISLFGISFTLMILIVLTSLLDHLFSAQYPEKKRDRMLYISMAKLIDTEHQGQMTGPLSFYFLDKYVHSMKTPEKVGITSVYNPTNTYINNKKLTILVKYTNAAYWDVMDFEFVEGRAYTAAEITNAQMVGVITTKTRDDYFGEGVQAVGKYIETDNVKYKVCGVVKSVSGIMLYSSADLYLPHTLSKTEGHNTGFNGGCMAVLLAKSKADMPKIDEEYQQVIARLPMKGMQHDKFISHAEKYVNSMTRIMLGEDQDSGAGKLFMYVGLFVLFFMLLPTLNLININISRIMERSSEIGVRKAFGASSRTLVYQFITENIILTLIGGSLGIVLSLIILAVINSNPIMPNMYLSVNYRVLGWALLGCLFFGLLSGVYPAWRMSRLQVVSALKAQ